MVRDVYEVLLPSGRGARLVELLPSEKDKVMRDSASLVGKDASMMDFKLEEIRNGVCTMIKELTTTKGHKSSDELRAEGIKWREVSKMDIVDNYDEYFTAKDDLVLSSLYRRFHEVSMDEIDAIAGKVQKVSKD